MSTLEHSKRWGGLYSLTFWGLLPDSCLPPTAPFLPPHMPRHTNTHLLFCFHLILGLSVFLSSTFPLPSTPPHLSAYVSPLALLLSHLTPFEVWDSSKSNVVLFGQPRGNGSERGAQVRLQLLIKNLHYPELRDVKNDFGFDLSKPLYVTCADLYEDIFYILHFTYTHTMGRIRKMETW